MYTLEISSADWAVELRTTSDHPDCSWMAVEAILFVRLDLANRTITRARTRQEKLDLVQSASEDSIVLVFDHEIAQDVFFVDDRGALIEALQ